MAGGDGRGPATEVAMYPLDVASYGGRTYVVDTDWASFGSPIIARPGVLRVIQPGGAAEVGFAADRACGTACPQAVTGVAVGPSGEVYVSDRIGERIFQWHGDRRFTPVAGSGEYGRDLGGQALRAAIALGVSNRPDALAVDAQGRVLFGSGYAVLRVESDGTLNHIAGTGDSCCGERGAGVDVPAVDTWMQPQDVAVSPSGEIHIASESWVRRVDPGGILRRVVGDGVSAESGDGGPAAQARLISAASLAFDRSGNLFVASQGGVRRIDAATERIAAFAGFAPGAPVDGGPLAFRLSAPSLAVAGADLLMAQHNFSEVDWRVLRVPITGNSVHFLAGTGALHFSGDGRLAVDAQLHHPRRMATAPDGSFAIHDAGNGRVRRVGTDGVITTVAGGGTSAPAEGLQATAVALPYPSGQDGLDGLALAADGTVYFSTPASGEVWRVDPRAKTLHRVAGVEGAPWDYTNPGPAGPALTQSLRQASGLALADQDTVLLIESDRGLSAVDLAVGELFDVWGGGDIEPGDGAGVPAWAVRGYGAEGSSSVSLDDVGGIVVGDESRVYRISGCGSYQPVWSGGSGPRITSTTVVGQSVLATGSDGLNHIGVTATRLDNVPAGTDHLTADAAGQLLLSHRGDGTVTRRTPPPAPAGRPATADCSEGEYQPVVPARLLDTRSPLGGHPAPLAPGEAFVLPVTGVGGVPAEGVSAVVLNVTVTEPTTAGHVSVYPGRDAPRTSNLNMVPGQTVANLVTSTVAPDGTVTIRNSAGNTHLVVDVAGWFSNGTTGGGARFNPVVPSRLLDTRDGTGGPKAPLSGRESRPLSVTGRGGVPTAGVRAVLLNITVTGPTSAGHLTVWPEGAPRPVASNLNFVPGEDVPNLVAVAVGTDGHVRFSGSAGLTDVVADVVGWYGEAGLSSARLHAVQPYRLYDSRPDEPWAHGETAELDVLDVGLRGERRIPTEGVSAVVLNVTATEPTSATNVVVWPAGEPRPRASNLNVVAGETAPNLVTVAVGQCENGALSCIAVYNNAGSTHLVFDVVGWYEDDPASPQSALVGR